MYCSRYQIKLSDSKIIEIEYVGLSKNFRGLIPDYFQSSMANRIGLTSALAIPKKILQQYKFNVMVSSGQDTELFTKIAIAYPVTVTNQTTVLYEYSIGNQLSKTPIIRKKLFDFSQFNKAEKENKSLKAFLDLYRVEYALNFRIYGAIQKSNEYLKDVTTEIPLKTKILLKLPPFVLRLFLKVKHYLRSKGIDFTVYH